MLFFASFVQYALYAGRLLKEIANFVQSAQVIYVDMRELVVGDGKRLARAGIEKFVAVFFAEGNQAACPKNSVQMDRARDLGDAILRKNNDARSRSRNSSISLPHTASSSRRSEQFSLADGPRRCMQ